MNSQCPNKDCVNHKKNVECKEIYHYLPETNIDNIGHYHLECNSCGKQFNRWDCGIEKIKKIFGDIYSNYV